jgi:hypothetical protein
MWKYSMLGAGAWKLSTSLTKLFRSLENLWAILNKNCTGTSPTLEIRDPNLGSPEPGQIPNTTIDYR